MSLKNLENRIEKMEKVRGVNQPSAVITVRFINPDGTEVPLTPEETAALEVHRDRLADEPAGSPNIRVIIWTREEAQKLIAQQTGQEPAAN